VIDFGLTEVPVDDATQVVSLQGEVHSKTAPKLARRLLGLVDEGKTRVVVDLSGVTFMDSTGIGVLLNSLRQFSLRNAHMALVCPTERILRPFQITGLVDHLRIFASREEALGGLAAGVS